MTISKLAERVFKPNRQESEAQTTDSAARAIMDQEANERAAKTAKLRAARLAMEAAQSAEAAPVKKTRAKRE